MFEVIFLWSLALLWIVFATIQDLRSREIANWLSFSLIIFALSFRFFYSLFSAGGFSFFYQGLIGLGIFFILGNLLYYGRMFAGGDAKLMIALGAVLPIYETILENVQFFLIFLLLFFFSGAIYSLIVSGGLAIKNFKAFRKEFSIRLKANKKLLYFLMCAGLIIMLSGFINSVFFLFGVLLFITPYFYVFAKAIDESCMVKKINTKNLSEGDWLYSDLKMGNKKIKATWEGLNKKDIIAIRKKYRKIKIKQGIPFTPAFLISMVILFLFYLFDVKLWNFFW
ncbi:prepilin peptidase [Candidatus Pacearchaeota archaeon]|nr:prepilin peptidase [Candidatus Pacearchaeota archaeon]